MADIQDLSKLDHMCAWLMCGEAFSWGFRMIRVEVECEAGNKDDIQGTKVSVISLLWQPSRRSFCLEKTTTFRCWETSLDPCDSFPFSYEEVKQWSRSSHLMHLKSLIFLEQLLDCVSFSTAPDFGIFEAWKHLGQPRSGPTDASGLEHSVREWWLQHPEATSG